MLSGSRKEVAPMSSLEIKVSICTTGVFFAMNRETGSASVSMPSVWMATKSHAPVAMSSTALRCTSMLSPPSNQVTSTPNHLPHNSAVSFPEAHQVEPSPQFENAAFNLLPKGNALLPEPAGVELRHPASMPRPRAAAPASSPLRLNSSAQNENFASPPSLVSSAIDCVTPEAARVPNSLHQTFRK